MEKMGGVYKPERTNITHALLNNADQLRITGSLVIAVVQCFASGKISLIDSMGVVKINRVVCSALHKGSLYMISYIYRLFCKSLLYIHNG